MSYLNNKLTFYNKEGYNYNFTWNDATQLYEGKLIFDENSTDTFKTIAIYTFEKVSPINITHVFNFNKQEFYSYSGVNFISSTYSGDTILNILPVNKNSDFYSKWIYGYDFNNKYPEGTIISLSATSFKDNSNNIVNITDFNNKYFSVLETKPNAILITSNTRNDLWNYTFITGATIISHDSISLYDYNNSLTNQISGYTFHEGKKLNIVNSYYNEGIKTFKKHEVLKNYYQKYVTSGNTNDIFKLNITLNTERPKIYEGEVSFILSGNTARLTFKRGFNSYFNIFEGNSFICEDYYDNDILNPNPIFTITDGAGDFDIYEGNVNFIKNVNKNSTIIRHFNNSSKNLSSKYFIDNINAEVFSDNETDIINSYPNNFLNFDYYIEITGDTSSLPEELNIGDSIQLVAVNSISGDTGTKNENRTVTIDEIISFRNIRIDYWKNQIKNDPRWLKILKNRTIKTKRPLDEEIDIEAIYQYSQIDNFPSKSTYIPESNRTSKLKIKEYLIEELSINKYVIKKIISQKNINTLICSMSTSYVYSAFTMNIVAYDTSNIVTLEQPILYSINNTIPDYYLTINTLKSKYQQIFDDYGIKLYYESGTTDYIIIQSDYSYNSINEQYLDTTIFINNNSSITSTSKMLFPQNYINRNLLIVQDKLLTENIFIYEEDKLPKDINIEIMLDLNNNNNNYGVNLKANEINYYINFDTDTITTINNFVNKYYNIFYNNGFILFSGTTTNSSYTLNITGNYLNSEMISLIVTVNKFSNYEILKNIYNKGIIISANEIEVSNTYPFDFFEHGFSTGMLVSVSGSNYIQNNKMYNIIGLNENLMELSYQGVSFNENLIELNLLTEEYLRKPRESYSKNVYYGFKWEEPLPDENYNPDDIFYYDFTGEHLQPYLNDENLKYIGKLPLWNIDDVCNKNLRIFLNDEPNKYREFINDPTKQQTVFRGENGDYCLNFLLEQYDSTSNYNYIPEPLQTFIGYNSKNEGVSKSVLLMDKIEYIIFSGYTNSTTNLNGNDFIFTSSGILQYITNDPNFNFNNLGFEKGQKLNINFIDQRLTGSTIFENYGDFFIEYVSKNEIKIDITKLSSTVKEFSTLNNEDGYKYIIETKPRTLLKISIYGESENEDERFKINLNNLGVKVDEDVMNIFKDTDINEQGVDYIYLNQKRKEMLSMWPEIYNYLGSYKSLINAINFFGWNDLTLNEYYRNLDVSSPLYQKLQKVKIPDIFDNTVEGWTNDDWIKGKYQTGLWKKTNLFNLSYDITDENGNNILLYSLEEVQLKLNNLKKWLKRNILPLSTNLIDITGVADVASNFYQKYDVSNQVKKIMCSDDTTVVNFLYTETLNFSTNYIIQVDFYTMNNIIPSGWTCKIKTYSLTDDNKLIPQKYYKLLKNDLNSFTFNIDKEIDNYLYIETESFNDRGIAQKNNKMINTSTSQIYILINNNFTIPDYNYLNYDNKYYFYDKNGYIIIND
jgi:hypothetical protein